MIRTESPPNLYNPKKERKDIDKTFKKENGRRNQIRFRESITQGKGINTSHICCTQREPFS